MRKYALLDAEPAEFSLGPDTPTLGVLLFDFLKSIDPHFEAEIIAITTEELPQPDAFEGYIISGSPADAFDTDTTWIRNLRNFIRAAYSYDKKLVGICFGHQIIAQALGGEVNRAPGGWSAGPRAHQLLHAAEAWQAPQLTECTLFSLHADQVLKLPPDSTVIASTDSCPNSIILTGRRALGIQSHPEFTPEYVRQILAAPKQFLPPEVKERVLRDLDSKANDDRLIGKWLVNFLTGPGICNTLNN